MRQSIGYAAQPAPASPPRCTSAGDAERAAAHLAGGGVVAHGFANLYALTSLPDLATVRATNELKGRPAGQTGSVTTTPSRLTSVWDLSALPDGLAADDVHGVLDALYTLGPFGFRGPAAASVPDHLTTWDGLRTVQLIAPGYSCPSRDFTARALRRGGVGFLHITSANRSRHVTGARDEPAHHRAAGLRAEFAGDPRVLVLEHDGALRTQRAYPAFEPMSTSVLALHRLGPSRGGRRTLVLERHGSLEVDRVREALDPLGFDVVLGAGALHRLSSRTYETGPLLEPLHASDL